MPGIARSSIQLAATWPATEFEHAPAAPALKLLSQPEYVAELSRRAEAACRHAGELIQATTLLRLSSQTARGTVSRRDLLRLSSYARLLAQLDTMPVIEQAKGILMAQVNCGEAEAFDMLRRASQRTNVPVREVAARMVSRNSKSPRPLPQAPWFRGSAPGGDPLGLLQVAVTSPKRHIAWAAGWPPCEVARRLQRTNATEVGCPRRLNTDPVSPRAVNWSGFGCR